MRKKRYILVNYIRCGELPLYLIFYHDRFGKSNHSAMLCSFRKLKKLLSQFKGFDAPEHYGKIVYTGHENTQFDILQAMLKSRYDFDLSQAAFNGSRG